jgi:hypothetical protein
VDIKQRTKTTIKPCAAHVGATVERTAMKLNKRGKRVRAVVIYVLILTAIYGVSVALGVWDIPESCLVEQVGCPDGYPRY